MDNLKELAERVRQASRAGMDLDEIEARIIDGADVASGVKDALWILAFASLPAQGQRQVVRECFVVATEQQAALN